ncbi:MAG: hypothetical protein FWH05_00120 [Oscillospiraceae bacterium]|nr:hypothetical protein [Oscillospiraceae bacterium]
MIKTRRKIFTLALTFLLIVSFIPVFALTVAASDDTPDVNQAWLYGDARNQELRGDGYWGRPDAETLDFMVSVGSRVGSSGYNFTQYFNSYAFVGANNKVSWKDIKATDLTLDLCFDVSRIVKQPGGKLVLSSNIASANRTTFSSSGSWEVPNDSTVGFAVYDIAKIAPDPSVGKDKIHFPKEDPWSAHVDIGIKTQYYTQSYQRDGWQDAGGAPGDIKKWAVINIENGRETLFVRGMADSDDYGDTLVNGKTYLPSFKTIRVNLPSMLKAPNVRFNVAKEVLIGRAGWVVEWRPGNTWERRFKVVMTSNELPLNAPIQAEMSTYSYDSSSGTGSWSPPQTVTTTIPISAEYGTNMSVYIPSGNGRPASFSANLYVFIIGYSYHGNWNDPPTHLPAFELEFVAKQRILINPWNNDSPYGVEANIGGRWRKVRNLTTAQIPETGLEIRSVGGSQIQRYGSGEIDANFYLPSATWILRLTGEGTAKQIDLRLKES